MEGKDGYIELPIASTRGCPLSHALLPRWAGVVDISRPPAAWQVTEFHHLSKRPREIEHRLLAEVESASPLPLVLGILRGILLTADHHVEKQQDDKKRRIASSRRRQFQEARNSTKDQAAGTNLLLPHQDETESSFDAVATHRCPCGASIANRPLLVNPVHLEKGELRGFSLARPLVVQRGRDRSAPRARSAVSETF